MFLVRTWDYSNVFALIDVLPIMLRIRRFVPGDGETYVRVHNEGYSTERWWGTAQKSVTIAEASELDYDATFIAEVDGQAVGLVDIRIRREEAHVENLVVLSAFRRNGVGTRLLEKSREFLRSRGVKRIRVETPVQNAAEFFDKNGFKFVEHAFLIEIQDEQRMRPYLNRKLHFEGGHRYWVPSEKEMKSIKKLGVAFETIAKFRVMIKQL